MIDKTEFVKVLTPLSDGSVFDSTFNKQTGERTEIIYDSLKSPKFKTLIKTSENVGDLLFKTIEVNSFLRSGEWINVQWECSFKLGEDRCHAKYEVTLPSHPNWITTTESDIRGTTTTVKADGKKILEHYVGQELNQIHLLIFNEQESLCIALLKEIAGDSSQQIYDEKKNILASVGYNPVNLKLKKLTRRISTLVHANNETIDTRQSLDRDFKQITISDKNGKIISDRYTENGKHFTYKNDKWVLDEE